MAFKINYTQQIMGDLSYWQSSLFFVKGRKYYWRSILLAIIFLPAGNITGGQFSGGQYYYTIISIKENKVKVMTL